MDTQGHDAMLQEPDRTEPTSEPTAAAPSSAPAAPPPRVSALPPLPYMADAAQFGAFVHQQLAECRRWSVPLAVLSLGIANVQLVHDRHATALRAQLLQEAGLRLRSRVRATDAVVRVGRDGFGLVLRDATEATARNVEQRLTRALHMPYRIGSMLLSLTVQTGFAVYPQGGVTGEALVLAAERVRNKTGD